MGFSKEVSSDHHENDQWSKNSDNLELPNPRPTKRRQQQQQQQQQLQQQQPELVKCPRCESINTKFCYYNNYNKNQPRHFCKACKRHWTNGGTLRNVPVGGGRKNKRLKKPIPATTTNITTMIRTNNLPQGPSDIKTLVTKPTGNEWSSTDVQSFTIDMPIGSYDLTWDINGSFMNKSILQLPQNPSLGFESSSLSSFDPIPTSVHSSLSSLNCYKGSEKIEMLEKMEDSTITIVFPSCESSTVVSQPWEGTSTRNNFIDSPNYWDWNIGVDTMVLADLNIPWDDSEFDNP